jgi:hypothetical protein
MGVIMPVIEVQCRYTRPALFHELLTIKVILKELPVHHKIAPIAIGVIMKYSIKKRIAGNCKNHFVFYGSGNNEADNNA